MADELLPTARTFSPPAGNVADRFVTDDSLPRMLAEAAANAHESGTVFQRETIGASRAGRPMVGIRIGSGPHHVSITAGAHSDEPVGPMTAIEVVIWLSSDRAEAREICKEFTFFICPQVNPDGGALNSRWFADPLDPMTYLKHVVREQPGDDIEFGYPSAEQPGLRPENEAVARFLRSGAPYVYHASLHGMAYAEGAWFLIGKEWEERTGPLQATLVNLAKASGLPLHDMERHGEKGFSRIAPGICTTPTSTAMRQHFLDRDDEVTAAQFRPSSMEFVQSLGGDPLVMVSELPLFLIKDPNPRPAGVTPAPGETAYERFRNELPLVRAALERGDTAPAQELMQQYDLATVSLSAQVRLQGQMVLEGARFARSLLQ